MNAELSFASRLADGVTIVAFIVAFATVVIALRDYRRAVSTKNLEIFFSTFDEFWKNQNLVYLFEQMESEAENSPHDLDKIELIKKYEYLYFMEKIALMYNSGIINRDVTFYFFGYYAVLPTRSKAFWSNSGLSKDDIYWHSYMKFCEEMVTVEKKYTKSPWIVRL